MTRDELKEKVARALYAQRHCYNPLTADHFTTADYLTRKDFLAEAEAALVAIEGAGLAVVPVEATHAIMKAASGMRPFRERYSAMVEAGRVR